MTLPLKPDSIAALYEYARSLPPFLKLSMPDADDVEFWIVKDQARFAWYQWINNRHRISISASSIGYTVTLLAVLMHEMIHLHLKASGREGGGNENVHNAEFRKIASRVCKIHGLDPKAFF